MSHTARLSVSPWVLLIALVACGSDSPTKPTGPSAPLPVASVTVLPTPGVVFLVGTTAQLTASVKDSLGRALADRRVTWSSSAPSIATVDSTGLVTGVAAGSVTITATSEGKSGMAAVTVDAVDSFTIWMPPDTLFRGEGRPLVARAVGVRGITIDGVRATWSSSDIAVATIDTSGFLKAVGGGSATITATFEGESSTADVTVLVINFASVDAGTFQTCGLTTSGAAYCWGSNYNDLLGVGGTTETCPSFLGGEVSCSTTPKTVSGGLTFMSLSVANGFTCGLTSSGAAYCWGFNRGGQLGNGTTVNSTTPVAVSGGITFASLSAGGGHACALTPSGTAHCWGSNEHGQLGTTSVSETCENSFSGNTGPCSTIPVLVSGDLTFLSISAGGAHVCGLTPSGDAYCWGFNRDGQLGNGSTTGDDPNPTPFAVTGGLTFASVSAGGLHTCGVTTSDDAYCWGRNTTGQLGIGFEDQLPHPTPVLVPGSLTFASVSAGALAYTCGVTTDGMAYCWGIDWDGTLGNGTLGDMSAPVPVSGGLTFASVSASWFHTCGFTTNNEAYCWGSNDLGQLGNGTINEVDDGRRSPVPVLGQPSVTYSSLPALGRVVERNLSRPRESGGDPGVFHRRLPWARRVIVTPRRSPKTRASR